MWLVIVFSIPSVLAAGPAVRFERLSIENGLPQSSAKAILQDQQGFLWIGTEEGLARYDGYEFKVFKKQKDDLYSLSNNYIKVITQGKDGELWIGTRGGGINRFDPTTERFIRYMHDPNDANSLSDNSVHAITQDSQGNIWIGTDKGGLNRFNPSTKKFTHYRHQADTKNSISDDAISVITSDDNGSLWIGTWSGGLNHFSPKTGLFSHYSHQPNQINSLSNNTISAIHIDDLDNLWIGTRGSGLSYFNLVEKKFTHYKYQSNNDNSLSDNNVDAITPDKQGNLWLATLGGGLNYFNITKKQFTHYRYDATNPNSLSNDIVRAIIYDQHDNLWVGMDGGGLNRSNSIARQFTHYNHQRTDPYSLSHNMIRAITQDREGSLWIGTWGGGLNKFNSASEKFTHYRHDDTSSNSLNDDRIYAITQDKQGYLWLGADQGGLSRFDPSTEKFKHFRHDPSNINSVRGEAISVITEDRDGYLWLGSWQGLSRFNPLTEQFVHYNHDPNNSNSLNDDTIRVITEDRRGHLWLGTWKGVNHFNPDTQTFTHFTHQDTNPRSLSHNTVYAIKEDHLGNIWVGTASGLNLLDKATGSFTHYFEEDGLANNVIYRIEEDNTGIWLSTNQGLSHLNTKTKRFKNYNVSDGLQSNEFNADASFKSKTGELFFGGINGFNRFYPNDIKIDSRPPKVVFTDMLLSNKSVPVGEVKRKTATQTEIVNNIRSGYSLEKAIHSTSEITLTHKQNLVTFEFSGLYFSNSKKNQYAFQMAGLDNEWIKTDYKNRRATYTNLPTGEYILRVKASNPYGVWNETATALKIKVLPPPWLSWWAYTGYVVLVVLAIWLFVRAQYKKVHFIKKVNEQLELKVAERTLGLQQANAELVKLSVIDELTGLYNRRFLANNLLADIELVNRKYFEHSEQKTLATIKDADLIFFLIDIDHFKRVNDVYGHTAGDAVLMQIKDVLKQIFRELDYCVRWGGEEFLVVARFSERNNAAELAERLRAAIEKHAFKISDSETINKTCSIGFASYPFLPNRPQALSWERVVDIADHCLYAAKNSNRNAWIGLDNISCEADGLFAQITENTTALIEANHLQVKSSLSKNIQIKWQ